MIEAAMLWNEPNNKSHWDFEIDTEWQIFGEMVKVAAFCVHRSWHARSFAHRVAQGSVALFYFLRATRH